MDPINPAHYEPRDGSDIDCARAQLAGLGVLGYRAYLAGNAAKYVWRHTLKNGVQDIDKAIKCLEMLRATYDQ